MPPPPEKRPRLAESAPEHESVCRAIDLSAEPSIAVEPMIMLVESEGAIAEILG